jgi:hypothetical protein
MQLKKKIVPLANSPLAIFKGLPVFNDGRPEINQLRGSARSRLLLIAPPCLEEEYKAQVPFSYQHAQAFHTIIKEETGFDTDKDALVVSCSKFYPKANKESTGYICDFVRLCAEKQMFDRYVCVGDDAFKFIFGRGKKPSMASIMAQTMYVEETCYKPLFVFPSPWALYPDLNLPFTDEGKRERYFRIRLQDQADLLFRRLAKKFETFIKPAI